LRRPAVPFRASRARSRASAPSERPAQAADPDVDRARVDRRLLLAEPGDELFAGHHPVGVFGEEQQQAELVGRQDQRLARPARLERGHVDRQVADFEALADRAPLLQRIDRDHPVEDRSAVDRPEHVIVGPRLQRAAAVLGIIGLEHHRDVRLARARVGPQAAAHLEPGEIVEHPVDEGPDGALDQTLGAGPVYPRESVATPGVDEIVHRLGAAIGEKNIDHVHPCPRLARSEWRRDVTRA
jgi:hypothetical protein